MYFSFSNDDIIDPSMKTLVFGCKLPDFVRWNLSKLIGWFTNVCTLVILFFLIQ